MERKKRTLTAEQEAARDARRERFKVLAVKISAMTEDERATLAASLCGVATIEGRVLSLNNQLMVALQCPNATIVAGFQQWRKAGRMVRKGEHGAMIWAPTHKREETGTVAEDPHFITVTVFDVSQTEALEAERLAS